MENKNLCWITADYFLDVDIPIIKELKNYYQIEWYIFSYKGIKIDEHFLKEYSNNHNVQIVVVPLAKKQINPVNVLHYLKLLYKLKRKNYDLLYFDIVGFPYFHLLAAFILNRSKIVHAAHNVIDYEGWPYRRLMKIYIDFIFSFYKNFHIFSDFLKTYFDGKYRNKNTFFSPMALKDFGESLVKVSDEKIKILFFGNVKSNKRLDIIINAIQQLQDNLADKIHLTISGYCDNPDYYTKLIFKSHLFTTNFTRIPDCKIADLFCSHHYLILPYENVAQSGPHMIAYRYNLPTIASDIDGFKERIQDGINGYLFKVNDAEDLIRVLKLVIETHASSYNKIKSNLNLFVQQNYSTQRIISNYRSIINKTIENSAK